MIKTIKPDVTHKGKVLGVGTTIKGLKSEDEQRLVNDGWCEFVEEEQAKNSSRSKSSKKSGEQAESEEKPDSEQQSDSEEQPDSEEKTDSSSKWY